MDPCSLTHLVLSFSLFSIIVSYSTSYSCLLHSLKNHLYTLISHILDKNCIFLIFNGILVFLAKTSGFMGISNACATVETKEIVSIDSIQNGANEEYEDLNFVLEEEEEEEEEVVEPKYENKGEENGNVCNVQVLDNYGSNLVTINKREEEREEDGEDDDSDLLSSEDLNKKFDDFIRRMKEDFRSGAQQQLIAAC